MLTIRLHRIGKTNQPSFKMVVVDKRVSAAAGKFREEVGSINRVAKQTKLDKDRIVYWISKGAQPSATVNNILVAEKVIEGKKIAVHSQSKRPAAEVAPASGGKSQESAGTGEQAV